MKKWGRLITAMVTPFDENFNVDYKRAVELAKKLINEGTTALVITGTTGEAPTLSREEANKLYKVIKKEVDVPIIAGVGTNSTATTIENAIGAKESGADGLLVVTPYYNKPDQGSLYSHFKEVAESTDLPIMLYNVPGRTACNLLPETVEKLSKIKNIVALKEAGGNVVQFSEVVKRVDKDFLVYTGDDVLTLPTLAVGGYGVVSVSAHIVGRDMKEMIEAFLAGDNEKATKIHLKLLGIYGTLFAVANPIPVKAALNILGVNVGELRLPLTKAKPDILEKIEKELKILELI
ncbi:4-hydroxy-tetrahydrodipicolinate synthase [Tissierella creatinophila]|uniref:4-hydroxy-tetrahydrodipicolinate synthase n=1 Tax=Tissierella creatinophila DSM 6911 TaxID=1123403 RepID=A0A1U7M7K1_TISCR|nr:4-hydroxy-tetrahydrodipicolinate synthase [Tissierella creatinophila]OLS03266.1 4-hydroxy-tetrahydrodipicolinate synthase [Tissierella creatinophila DSM 6911]